VSQVRGQELPSCVGTPGGRVEPYPAACAAAADAGYDGLAPAAGGVRAVLAGEMALFRCRYQAPAGAGPFEVTVASLAGGDGAVVTHRRPPATPA
jgi:hypothetical protein